MGRDALLNDKRDAVSIAIEFMRTRLNEPIRLDDIAGVTHYSKRQLQKIFTDAMGLTLGRYLAKLRFERACELLRTTDWTVETISYEVGYMSVGAFSSLFRQHVGMPPGLYRRLAHDSALEKVM